MQVAPFSFEKLKQSESLLSSVAQERWDDALKEAARREEEEEGFDQITLRTIISEQLERFLTSKLFPLLSSVMSREAEDDIQLSVKFDWMERWISPAHLDVDPKLDLILSSSHPNLSHLIPNRTSQRDQINQTTEQFVINNSTTWMDLTRSQFNSLSSAKVNLI